LILFTCAIPQGAAQVQGRTVLDSLLRVVPKAKDDTAKVRLLCEVADQYRYLAIDSVTVYTKIGLQLADQLGDKYGQGMCLFLSGAGIHGYNGNMSDLMKALLIFEQLNDKKHVAMLLDEIAGHYYNMERYRDALIYFERELAVFESVKDVFRAERVRGIIGETYGKLGNFSKALDYQIPALQYFEQTNYHDITGNTLTNIGNAYLGLKEYNKALVYASRAVRLFTALHDTDYRIAFALSDMGHIYFTAANDKTSSVRADSLLSGRREENLAKAIYYYTEAHRVYERYPHFIPTNIALRLSNALAATGQYAEALKYYKEHAAFKDSFLSEDTRLKVAAAETMREADLKERQIAINKVQEAAKTRERWSFGISLCLLGLVIMLVWRNYSRQKLVNEKLADEKVKLEAANRHIAEEKRNSDKLAANLGESLTQKEALAAQLAAAAEMKTRFLANISHEIRTPVTLLSGMLELMKNKVDVLAATDINSDKNMLEVAYNNSRKLRYMVEEILDLSKLETKEILPKYQKINAPAVCRRMVYAFETLIEKEQLKLQYTEGDVQGIYISADENMLEKIINNLIYNAIKFNEPGGRVRVNLMRSSNRESFILTVNNSGATVSVADLPHIFERFYQGDSTIAKSQGFGIGLSLVKEFTTFMNGTVDVTSKDGAGTTFTLQFPIVAEDLVPEVTMETAEEPDEPAWERFRARQTVLLVEDNAEMRYYIKQVLKDKVNLAEAANGKKALEWLAKNKADLVITDLMMPEMGGEEFMAFLKKDEVYRKMPAITLTALADTDSRLSMQRLGIDDYIVKPFNALELRVRVYNLLNNLHERQQFADEQTMPGDVTERDDDADLFREKINAFVLPRLKTTDVSVDELSAFFTMSTRQLYRLSKKLTGCTPAQLIKEVKLQKAYQLLLSGSVYKIDDVAKQVGFDDANYFSKQFTARFGKRPHDFFK
jgi:signal transduction histidine kinase/DNA-binding response OmpR family regulator